MTKQIMVGGVPVGGGAPVSIQSMCSTKTHDVPATVDQIHRLEAAGCEIIRVAVPDMAAAKAIGENGGKGIPTVKPWDRDTLFAKLDQAKASGAQMFAMDIDAAGLPFLKGLNPPAGSKTVAELREVIEYAKVPFILKGVMTVRGAKKALEAGAAGIVVSNHGGRVLDGVPATAEVLPAIAEAVKGRMVVMVDGGIRSGVDVCKALALGADACILARPYVTAVYGGGAEGVKVLTDKIKGELADTMAMCGVHSLAEISRDMIF